MTSLFKPSTNLFLLRIRVKVLKIVTILDSFILSLSVVSTQSWNSGRYWNHIRSLRNCHCILSVWGYISLCLIDPVPSVFMSFFLKVLGISFYIKWSVAFPSLHSDVFFSVVLLPACHICRNKHRCSVWKSKGCIFRTQHSKWFSVCLLNLSVDAQRGEGKEWEICAMDEREVFRCFLTRGW